MTKTNIAPESLESVESSRTSVTAIRVMKAFTCRSLGEGIPWRTQENSNMETLFRPGRQFTHGTLEQLTRKCDSASIPD
jgi:hypothetical protein